MSFPNPALLKNDVFLDDSPLIYCSTFWESPKNTNLCQSSRQLPCKETMVCLPNWLWFWVQPWRTSVLCFWGMLVFWSPYREPPTHSCRTRPHRRVVIATTQYFSSSSERRWDKPSFPDTSHHRKIASQSHARETLSHRSLQICK